MADQNQVTKALQESPLPGLIQNLGIAIAQAQYQMDLTAAKIAKLLGSEKVEIGETEYSLLELGFTPTFYQLTEATVEAKMTLSCAESKAFSIGMSAGVNLGYFAASVDASYSAKYSFEATGSSAITARFVSVPPPTIFLDRLSAKKE